MAPPALRARALSRRALAVLEDQSIACWGGNDFGQLGDGTTALRKEPVSVPL